MKDLVSIIIRGKNEEDWLGLCLRSIREQTYTNHEIIYVDNESSDSSIDIAKYYKVAKIKKIKHFLPGEAINIGIKASKGIYIVIISAHCIPRDKNWLSALVQSIQPDKIAGVYGRQLPLPSTSPDDARDLLISSEIFCRDGFYDFTSAGCILIKSKTFSFLDIISIVLLIASIIFLKTLLEYII